MRIRKKALFDQEAKIVSVSQILECLGGIFDRQLGHVLSCQGVFEERGIEFGYWEVSFGRLTGTFEAHIHVLDLDMGEGSRIGFYQGQQSYRIAVEVAQANLRRNRTLSG